jgi:thioredoxin-dependent peroxiredoxin
MKAPDFSLPDEAGVMHKLSDYFGNWVVLYFYPKDDTPGCTKEACDFRDKLSDFQKLGVEVVGISKDSVDSHLKFKEKYNLNFHILSDKDHEVISKYGAWGKKKLFGVTYEGTMRKSFLIDPTGDIIHEYKKVDPLVHAKQILSDVKTLANNFN